MKTLFLILFACLSINICLSQSIPSDSLYLSQTRPGNTPVIFQLQFSSGLRPVERVSVSSDGKEIYYGELDNWPASVQRIKCYKYQNNMWQGPFAVFEGFVGPALSVNDSTIYMQKDINGVACSFYSVRNGTGWSAPVRLLSSSLQSHYFRETQLKHYYLASTPGGSSDICRLVINNTDTTIQSLGSPINNTATENDFFIAKDESFIIFFRLTSPYDLFISYHKSNGSWTNPKSLGSNINTNNNYECCPYVTNDNKYLFFTRGNWPMSTYNTYWVKIDNVIDSLKYTNFIPYLKNQIADRTDSVGHLFSFTIPDSTFIDDDGNNTLTYSATQGSGSALPSWLSFNPATRTLSGTPSSVGAVWLKVIATDNANALAACYFTLNIVNHTSVRQISEITADNFKLFQNYPNPFNPATVIRYSIPENSRVSLKVYDILGKEVAVLVNSVQKSGIYEVSMEMNKLNLSSGIYIYTITATEQKSDRIYRETKAMNYIK